MNTEHEIKHLYTAEEYINQSNGIVTLCGSTKFFWEAMEANRRLTFSGWMVFMCGSWGHSFHKYTMNKNTDYEGVKRLHYKKILNSNLVVVVTDESGYIGSSTKAEIAFCSYQDIPVFYFDGKEFGGGTFKDLVTNNNNYVMDVTIDRFETLHGTLGF